jgi:hypothetical protein
MPLRPFKVNTILGKNMNEKRDKKATIRFTEAEYKRMKRFILLAKLDEEEISMNQFVVDAVIAHLDNLEKGA